MILDLALSLVQQQLNAVAQSADYWTILNTTFGTSYNQSLATRLQQQWQAEDFSALPPIQVLSSDILGNINGAYAASNNTIYLSESFLAVATPEQVTAVLLEEIGHFVDAQINSNDTPGDEGELFSLRVRGITPTANELNRLQSENDQAIITIDGQQVAIEMAAEPTLAWAKSFGGTDFDQGFSLAVDSSGNVYSTGLFQGTADFDPGTGTTNLTSAGNSDIFISKLNSDGSFAWAKRLGGTGLDRGNSLAVDSSGNVYSTGVFLGTVDFGGGDLTSAGNSDIFISKLNSDGSFAWAKSFGSSIGNDQGNSLAVDSSGNVYSTGVFLGTVDFDPGAGTSNLTSVGNQDIFISKLNSDGSFAWAKSFGSSIGNDQGNSLAVDSSGNVYSTGSFQGTVDFGGGNLTSAGSDDVFISKLNSDGSFAWAKRLGGTSGDIGKSLAVDSSGNVYSTGFFQGTVDFDPGAGTSNLTSAGARDVFISKLNSDGSFAWAKSFGSTNDDQGNSLAVDSSGNVYGTGFFQGTVDFDPGAGTSNLTSVGNQDIFISKLNSDGSFAWAKRLGGTSGDIGNSLAVDSSGNVYGTGLFQGTADFDPSAGTTNLTSTGGEDVFVVKLTPDEAPTAVTLQNQVTSLAENTNISSPLKVADIAITDDGVGTNTIYLTGADANNFEILGTGLYLKANTILNYEAKASYNVIVNVDDTIVGSTPDVTTTYSLNVTDVNEAPTAVTLQNPVTSLVENTSTASRIKVADIAITDDALGTNTIYLTGADANNFEILGTGLYLKANTVLNYEAQASYNVTVNVDDTTVGSTPDVTTTYSLNVTDVNEAPTAITLQNLVTSLVENTSTASRIKVADIAIDDALGSNTIYLTGADASNFEILGTGLYLKANTVLNYEAKASYNVTVNVDDTTVGSTPDVTTTYSLNVTDVNEAPTAVTLQNLVTSLVENTSTASRIKVADIAITDDALGTNTIYLTGADASNFEVLGTGLYLKANTVLNYEAKASYNVTVNVDDTTVGSTPDVTTTYSLNVTNVNEAPTAVTLQNSVTNLAEDVSTASRIKVADIAITDDALGTNLTYLTGADASSFEILGTGLYLKANTVLNYEAQASYNVTVNVDDTTVGSTPDVTTTYSLNVTDVNEAPTAVTLQNLVTSLVENTSTASGIKVADIAITDDALGSNTIYLTGDDASNFEVIETGLYLKANTILNYEAQASYNVTVNVVDGDVAGSTPDPAEVYSLNVTNQIEVTIAPGTTPSEGGAIGTYTITLDSPAPTGGLVVNFNTTGSTATLTDDYTLSAGTNITNLTANSFTIAAGQTTATLNLTAVADAVNDPGETVQINLTSGGDYSTAILSNKTDFATGRGPYSVAVGDFNGDGKLDLATANIDDNTVSVLLRNSDNTGFEATTDFATGNSPYSVAVGDFNGDGKLDLATANNGDSTVSVLLRKSDNTGFEVKTDFATGNSPYSVAVGDFNGDGKLDLATTNAGDSTVSVLLSNSDNTGFGAKTDFATGNSPYSVAVGDFNGDSKLDLATANAGDNTVSVLLRNSTNTGFEAKTDFATGATPLSIAMGDFNSDGKLDLATANYNDNTVSVFLRNIDNTGFEAKTDFATGNNPNSVAVGDFNGDGKLDLATTNLGNSTVSVFLRNSDNTGFEAKTDFATGNNLNSVAVGDFNGDGKLDLATANASDSTVSILLNTDPSVILTITNNLAPTAVSLQNQVPNFAENTSTATRLKVADVVITDDGLGTNNLSVSGADASAFEVDATGLYIKAGTVLNFEAQSTYQVTVNADDTTVGNTPDATTNFSLTLNNLDEVAPTITSGSTATAINENSGANQLIYTVTSTDTADIATGSTTYSLKNVGDFAAFTIDANSGQVRLISNPDYETKPSYSFTVIAKDAANNQSEKAVTLGIIDRAIFSINNVSFTEGGSSQNFTVTAIDPISNGSSTATVNYATANNTALAGYDYTAQNGVLTFSTGTNTRTINIPITNDTLYEPTAETFRVNLSNASSNATIANGIGTGTINDNDPGIGISVLDRAIVEGSGGTNNVIFQIVLSAPGGQNVTVQYATADGTAVAGSDYTSTTGTLTFLPGATTLSVTVPINPDSTIEPDETFFLNLSNPTGGLVISDGQGLGTLINDDGVSGLTLTGTAAKNTLTGNTGDDTLIGLGEADALTGGGGADKFVYNNFGESLLSALNTCDNISGFNPGEGDRIDLTSVPSAAFFVGTMGSSIGTSTLNAAYAAANNNTGLGTNEAVFFGTGTGRTARLYLAVNDGIAGFNAGSDLVIEVSRMTGAPTVVGSLTPGNYFI